MNTIDFNKSYVSQSGNTYHFRVAHARKQSSGIFASLADAWKHYGISNKFMLTERDFDDMLRDGETVLFLEEPVVDQNNFIGIALVRATK